MYKSFDFKCCNENCGCVFEDLIQESDPDPNCPECSSPTDRLMGCNNSANVSSKMRDLFTKFRNAERKYANASKEARPRL